MSKFDPEQWKQIGKVVGFHGLKGDLKVRPASPEADWVGVVKNICLQIGEKTHTVTISQAKIQDRLVFCRLQDYPDRTSVEPFLKAEIYASVDDLPQLEEGEFWVDDIIGLTVLDAKTRSVIGKVNDLVSAGAQDYLEIIHQLTHDKVLIPMNEHFVPEVNAKEGFVALANLDGFFDDMVDEAVEAF